MSARASSTGPLEQVVRALDGAIASLEEANNRMLDALVSALDLQAAAIWRKELDGQFVLVAERGHLIGEAAASGVPEEPVRSREPLLMHEQERVGTPRWERARRDGAVAGVAVPVLEDGQVSAVVEAYGRTPQPGFGREEWETVARLLMMARRQAFAAYTLKASEDDREAVSTVVAQVGTATHPDAVLRSALDSVRTAFGWAYGSFWRLDEASGVLRFEVESGSAGDEFRQVTLAASFAEGVGLSGRAWASRDLVFVRDLAEMTDCVRAPAAQRAGVKSGVCFPLMDNGRVVGTMDFFVTTTIQLSESRAAALRNVQALVSQRLSALRQADEDNEKARRLLDTVSRLREAANDAGHVAQEAVDRSSIMTDEVEALGRASSAIGDVIQLISGIAGQTNLLALNATIEAARAGEVGRGFAVVAQEVKDLARATATATKQVADQVAGLQASSAQVASGITRTGEVIGRLGQVQARMDEVLEEQVRMAREVSRSSH